MSRFNGERLRIIRQLGELTQTDLAEAVVVSQPTIADYERNLKEPTTSVVEALAAVGRVNPAFFFEQDDERFAEDEYNFRRRLTATEKLKKKVAAQASLFGMVVRRIRAQVSFPDLDIPNFPVSNDDEI